jgi:RHS repeat-associated protein
MTWGYDSDSRVASFANASHPSENLSYTYDHDSQLITAAASYGGYGGGYGGGSYSWDGNGDPTGKTVGKGNRLLADGTFRYEYDASGHMTKRTAISGGAYTVYTWDNRGRMASVTNYTSGGTPTQAVSLWYDAFNDLIGRSVTPYTNGNPGTPTTARFVCDLTGSIVDVAPDPTAPGNPAAAADTGQAVLAFNGNASLTDRFLWGPAVDQILADERYSPSGSGEMPAAAGTTYFALGDNENSVRDWIVPGSLVDHIIYDSFGKIYSQSNSAYSFPFLHNGVFYDVATGLEWHSQSGTGLPGRWYMPAIQHWMSEDPSGLDAGPNPWEYSKDSATNYIDPTGLQGQSKEDIIRALGGGKADATPTEPISGTLTFRAAEGPYQLAARVLDFDGLYVNLKDDKGNVHRVKIDKLSADDQRLLKTLRDKPRNIVIDPSSLKEDEREKWERGVITELGALMETKKGKEICGKVSACKYPPRTQIAEGLTADAPPINEYPVTIEPRQAKRDNFTKFNPRRRGDGARNVTIFYDPFDAKGDATKNGDRDRPPFVGLAKELFTANQALRGMYAPDIDMERSSRSFENQLREELGLPPALIP